jgi:hypothetical protein
MSNEPEETESEPVDTSIVIHEPQEHAMQKIQEAPAVILHEAMEAARALKDVISKKKRPFILNGQQYLEFEDWQTLGKFYGITAKEDGDPVWVEMGGVSGFKASSIAIDRYGRELSRATAYCLNDEEKWAGRTKYAYLYVCKDGTLSEEDPGLDQIVWEPNPSKPGKSRPKKERKEVGTETVPLFQLASMSQTRANAKALRNVLSWVAVLADYRPTPAEELSAAPDPIDDPKPAPKKTGSKPTDSTLRVSGIVSGLITAWEKKQGGTEDNPWNRRDITIEDNTYRVFVGENTKPMLSALHTAYENNRPVRVEVGMKGGKHPTILRHFEDWESKPEPSSEDATEIESTIGRIERLGQKTDDPAGIRYSAKVNDAWYYTRKLEFWEIIQEAWKTKSIVAIDFRKIEDGNLISTIAIVGGGTGNG